MTLLREIQDAAIDTKTDLAGLLRKCKVLAVRLGSEEFKCWVDSELSGYSDKNELPEYRVLHVNSKGHFSGVFGSGMNNADIPISCLPERFQEIMSVSQLTQSVASIESLVTSADTANSREPWNPDLVALVGRKIYQNMNCVQAWKVIPRNSLIGVLDEIRTRILNFVLEIEAQDPSAGEAAVNSIPVPEDKVNQIFNTVINGSVQNVATGSHSFKQHANKTEANAELFDSLLAALESIRQSEVTAPLCRHVEGMRSTQGTGEFRVHYQHFMSFLADHMQVLGPAVAPFLAGLSAIVP